MLEVLGLDQPAEALYLALVDNPPMSVDELCQGVDIDVELALHALTRLEEGGLISRLPGPVPSYTALPPDHALEVLILARERDIHRARALTDRLAERHREARRSRDSRALIEVVTGRDGVARCGQQLFKRAEREIRGIDAPPYAQAIDGQRVNSAAAVVGRAVQSRFLHARDTLVPVFVVTDAGYSSRAASYPTRFAQISSWWLPAQSISTVTASSRLVPRSVNAYSTRGGTSA